MFTRLSYKNCVSKKKKKKATQRSVTVLFLPRPMHCRAGALYGRFPFCLTEHHEDADSSTEAFTSDTGVFPAGPWR